MYLNKVMSTIAYIWEQIERTTLSKLYVSFVKLLVERITITRPPSSNKWC